MQLYLEHVRSLLTFEGARRSPEYQLDVTLGVTGHRRASCSATPWATWVPRLSENRSPSTRRAVCNSRLDSGS